MRKTFVVDIDGTLCSNTDGAYLEALPYRDAISTLNSLHSRGHKIILFTARGSTTGVDWRSVTEGQLLEWDVKYHELHFGKPFGDYYIDDKAIAASWLRNVSDLAADLEL